MDKPPPPKPEKPGAPPPARATAKSSDSFRAVAEPQEEKLWKELRDLQVELKDQALARGRDIRRTLELKDRLDEHEKFMRDLGENLLDAKRMKQSVEDLGEKVDRLDSNLTKALEQVSEGAQKSLMRTVTSAREDADQKIKLIELEAKLREIGASAGKKAGLTWGSGAALVGTILGAAVHYLYVVATASGH